MPIVAIAVDDEPMGVANVAAALQAHPGWTLHGTARSGREARALLESGNVDAVFLDIEMPGESGLDVARSLGIMEAPPVIIFVTAYHRFAVEAFELHALDYLLKPFDDERFGRSIARARNSLSIMQARPYRSRTGRLGRSGQPRSSSPSWARQTTPMPRRPGRKHCPIGLVRIRGPSPSWAACRRSLCPITYGAA